MIKRSQNVDPAKAVTAERAARLHRLLSILADSPRNRADLIRRLRMDVRGFYRDLNLLRSAGIDLALSDGRYHLTQPKLMASARLPFPDPHLTLGEAMQLAKGKTSTHRRLAKLVKSVVNSTPAGGRSTRHR